MQALCIFARKMRIIELQIPRGKRGLTPWELRARCEPLPPRPTGFFCAKTGCNSQGVRPLLPLGNCVRFSCKRPSCSQCGQTHQRKRSQPNPRGWRRNVETAVNVGMLGPSPLSPTRSPPPENVETAVNVGMLGSSPLAPTRSPPLIKC